MILVTLGTQFQPFTRLLDYVSQMKFDDEIIVQAGYTKYKHPGMRVLDFMSYEEMDRLVNEAELIITHAGTGSIITPLQKGKKVIACARLKKYGEHINDHQLEILSAFVERGHILAVDEQTKLEDVKQEIKEFVPVPFVSNTHHFLKKLKDEIDNYF